MQLSHPTGGHLRRRSLRAAGGLRGAGAGSPPTAEAAMTMPDTITRLGLWPHQENAVSFVHNLWNRGRKGAMLSMAMGCVEGDAEIIIVNRAGNGKRITIRELCRKFHGG